jgi:hypothetical protein
MWTLSVLQLWIRGHWRRAARGTRLQGCASRLVRRFGWSLYLPPEKASSSPCPGMRLGVAVAVPPEASSPGGKALYDALRFGCRARLGCCNVCLDSVCVFLDDASNWGAGLVETLTKCPL